MTDLKQKDNSPVIKTNGKEEPAKPTVPFSKLFRFATKTDKLLMTIGALAAAVNGFAMPAFSFIFGQMIDQFSPGNEMD